MVHKESEAGMASQHTANAPSVHTRLGSIPSSRQAYLWEGSGVRIKLGDIALVREARKGLGDDADLMIDAGLVWDAKTAIQRARSFADSNIFWLEEPLRPDDYVGYRKLSEATHLRIAAGEEESGRQGFLQLMDAGKIGGAGGPDPLRRVHGSVEDREPGSTPSRMR
jgi:L-alanine-DL-glutamate epimerase-like enolase superfamily enzyme